MAANYIELPVDGTGKKVQTWDNVISGNDVHTEASVSTDTTGVPVGTPTNPIAVINSVSSTASAPANTAVTSASSSVLDANPARKEVIITNTDVYPVYLGLGQTPTSSAYHIVLAACAIAGDGKGGVFISDIFQGQINAIVASTTGHIAVVELV